MTTQTTYRPIQSATTGTTFGGLLRLVIGIVGIALVAGWLLSSYRTGAVIPINEPLPTVAQDPAVVRTIQIATGNPDFPHLTFELEVASTGYTITDPDGDTFSCESLPVAMRDLDACVNGSAGGAGVRRHITIGHEHFSYREMSDGYALFDDQGNSGICSQLPKNTNETNYCDWN